MGNIAWVDIETTGLSVHTDRILEVALVITDEDLKILSTTQSVVYLPVAEMLTKNQLVKDMHTNNGLFEEAKSLDTSKPGFVVANEMRDEIRLWGGDAEEGKGLPMAGSSVQFDRRMLAQHMPGFEMMFHYRNIDVSTLRTLTNMWRPDLMPPDGGDVLHRGMSDIVGTINQLRHFAKALWNKEVSQ